MEIFKRELPTLNSFDVVLDRLRDDVEGCEGIWGGLVLGSVLHGQHTIRSDLDFLFAYKADREAKVSKAMHSLCAFAADRHVPVQLIPIRDDIGGRTIYHTLTLPFLENLSGAAENGGVVKDNPLRIIEHPPESTVIDSVGNYVGHKVYQISSGLMSVHTDDAARCRYLSKVLEAPIHIARRMVYAIGAVPLRGNDTKASVPELYRQSMENGSDDPELADLLEEILRVDAGYSVDLERQVRSPSQPMYEDGALREIWKIAPKVLEFAQRNLLVIGRRF